MAIPDHRISPAGPDLPADDHTAPAAPSLSPSEKEARTPTWWWTASTAIALLSGAAWLRGPAVPYLVVCSAATVATVVQTLGRRRIGARVAAVALLAFCALAGAGQWTLAKIEHAWPATEADISTHATAVMRDELQGLTQSLARSATSALDAPAPPAAAFTWIAPLARGPGDRGIVVYRAGVPVAWAGRISAPIDSSGSAFAVVRSSFYVVLQATAVRGEDRAIATAVLHADPPADRLTDPLDADVAARTGVDSFAVSIPTLVDARLPGPPGLGTTLRIDGVPLVTLRAVVPRNDQARVSAVERVTSRAALIFAAAMLAFVVAEWRPRTTMWWRRVLALAVPFATLAIVPLNAFSNASRLFDPTYFFSPVGGPYTASVGALGVTGVVGLLAALAAARARVRLRPGWLAISIAVLISVGALVALRQIAGGITPPVAAVSLLLWVGWQIALALVTTALLVAGAVAAHSGMGTLRGLPPIVPIALAVVAAGLAPSLWHVNEGWPAAYQLLWCAAALAAAFARRTRWAVVPAAVVAALASAVIIWSTTADKRALLAERDLAGLMTPDPEQVTLLERLAAEMSTEPTPMNRADLLKTFSRSDLAAAAYPVRLGLWSPDHGEWASLALARFDRDSSAVASIVDVARRHATIVLTSIMGYPGVRLVLAVPAEDGQVMTAIVAPPSRLFTENAFAMLVGLASDAPTSDDYSISPLELVPRRRVTAPSGDSTRQTPTDSIEGDVVPRAPDSQKLRRSTIDATLQSTFGAIGWRRIGSDLHGDWLVPSNLGAVRLHVEVPLRPFDALAQRALLLVVADLIAVLFLWVVSAAGDGLLSRWFRIQSKRWARSYRTQLIVVLFMFFVVPAVLFAVWSYRRLRSDDAEERALLVWQTLRAAATGGLEELPSDADRVGTPLLLYQGGRLSAASDSIFLDVAPLGRFLRPDVQLDLGLGKEVRTSHAQALAGMPVLFGYRAFEEQTILAAPARIDEIGVESRRTDLGILVLFSVVLGAGAALWLSGLAARQLARPIDALRRAAVAVAAGEREPDLAGNPPTEFAQVFGAFRRMAADFGESQRVLAWGEMARQVAHEIKNPLTPIRLGIQHLQRARAAGRADFDSILNQNAGRILAEIDRLDRIARTFSQYGLGSTERAPAEPTDLSPVLRDVVELERLDVATGIVWELTGVGEPIVVHARAEEAREVVLNVLENARLASAKHVRVRVRRVGSASDPTSVTSGGTAWRNGPGRAVILVEDDGEGIPAHVLPRVFEPRFSTRTSGSGLGLAVSRRVVEGWGGTISVQSQPGKGTRVTIVLLLAGT